MQSDDDACIPYCCDGGGTAMELQAEGRIEAHEGEEAFVVGLGFQCLNRSAAHPGKAL